jgi:hypothetical protein
VFQIDHLATHLGKIAIAVEVNDEKTQIGQSVAKDAQLRLHRLSFVQGRARHHFEIAGFLGGSWLRIDERRHRYGTGNAACQSFITKFQPVICCAFVDVTHRLDGLRPLVQRAHSPALNGAREFEGKARFRRCVVCSLQSGRRPQHTPCLNHGVRQTLAAIGAHHIHQIRHRPAEIRPIGESLHTQANTIQTRQVAGIAVRVPTRRDGNHHAALQIVPAQQQRGNNQGVVRPCGRI